MSRLKMSISKSLYKKTRGRPPYAYSKNETGTIILKVWETEVLLLSPHGSLFLIFSEKKDGTGCVSAEMADFVRHNK